VNAPPLPPARANRIELVRHRNAADWTEAVAAEIAQALAQALYGAGQGRVLLSGGSTPRPVYEALAEAELDWARVEFGLVDERWLSPTDRDSNAWLLRDTLGEVLEDAHFEPLVRPGLALADCVHAANVHAGHARAPCLAVLGMGDDGHTASMFPGSRDLPRVLASQYPYAALDATGCPGANAWPLRITLTPAGLGRAQRRMLLLRGARKLEVLQAALAGDDPAEYPIRLAMDLPGPPLRVHWCA
jgi:6-phosphogluconolactonase